MSFDIVKYNKENPRPDYLYHYTTMDGFLGIIKYRTFWATHILYQSDRSEFKYAFQILKDVLVNKKINMDKLLLEPEKYKGIEVFTVSFSEKFDIQDQWNDYAKSVPGYCLGVRTWNLVHDITENSQKLIEYTGKSRAIKPTNAFECNFRKCIYDRNIQYEFIEYHVNEILNNQYETENLLYSALIEMLLKYSPIMKRKKYEEEQEWRFIISKVFDNSKINIRSGKLHFVPYFELDYKDTRCIRDIYIGHCPELEREIIKDSVNYTCYKYGKAFNIRENGGIHFINDFIHI
jgi:hypothetical protein